MFIHKRDFRSNTYTNNFATTLAKYHIVLKSYESKYEMRSYILSWLRHRLNYGFESRICIWIVVTL